jgi:hypothetical protein
LFIYLKLKRGAKNVSVALIAVAAVQRDAATKKKGKCKKDTKGRHFEKKQSPFS